MAAGVRSIVVRWVGDTKGLDQAGKDGEKAIGKWQGAFKKLDKVATGVLVGLGGAILGAVATTVRAGDEIAKAARTAGVSAEPFQELRFAFGQAGVDAGQFDASLRRLNRRLGLAADGGGPAVKAFEKLDIATRDVNGGVRDTTDVLEEALPKLAAIESDAERAAMASALFGDTSGPALAAALAEGIDGIDAARQKAQELGIVMDQEALDASEQFSDAMDDLKQVGVGLIRDFALPFLEIFRDNIMPVLQNRVIPAVRTFGNFISNNRGAVVAIAGALLGLAAAIKTISVVLRIVTAVQWAWNIAMAANPIGLIIIAIVALIAIIVVIIMYWDEIKEAFAKAWNWVWEHLKKFGRWLKQTFWDNGLKRIFGFVSERVQAVRDTFAKAFDRIRSVAESVRDFITSIPGKIRDGFSNLFDIVTAPFKRAFNAVAGFWNNTVGQISFAAPDWVPGIGGKGWSMPQIPTFHSGGVVPGRVGEEQLILAQGGETVRTPEQEAALGGDLHLTVDLGEGIERRFTISLDKANRGLKRRVLAGAGAVA